MKGGKCLQKRDVEHTPQITPLHRAPTALPTHCCLCALSYQHRHHSRRDGPCADDDDEDVMRDDEMMRRMNVIRHTRLARAAVGGRPTTCLGLEKKNG